jgi:type I restriction enzyme, S subunit
MSSEVAPLSELAYINPRSPAPVSGKPTTFVAMEDISESGQLTRARTLPAAAGYTPFVEGDVLLAKITPCLENGKGAHARRLPIRVAQGSTEFHVLRARPGVHDRYLFHWTRTPTLRRAAEAMMTGSAGQRRVPAAFFDRFTVPVLNEQEQHRAAEILDSLDGMIRVTERLIEKRTSHFHSLASSLLAPSSNNDDECRLGEIVPSVDYGVSTPLDSSGRTPVMRMGNLRDGAIDADDLRWTSSPVPPLLLLRDGDVLFNRTNSIDHVGRTSIWRSELDRATFASYLVRLNPDRTALLPDYLNYLLNLPSVQRKVRRWATTAVQQVNINPTNLRNTLVAIPPKLDVQQKAVDILDNAQSTIHRESKLLERLDGLRAGLADDLLTGRVRTVPV